MMRLTSMSMLDPMILVMTSWFRTRKSGIMSLARARRVPNPATEIRIPILGNSRARITPSQAQL